MYYIVFSRIRKINDGITDMVYYVNTSKSEAIEAFTTAQSSTFSVNALPGTLHFAGFKADLPFIKELIKEINKQPKIISDSEIINEVLRNIGLATCMNTLNISGYKPTVLLDVHKCESCSDKNKTTKQTVYKEYLCADCWVSYWSTRKSLAEYVIGLANGTYKIESFSEADKKAITDAWEHDDITENSSNRDLLLTVYTDEELSAIEAASGLFNN